MAQKGLHKTHVPTKVGVAVLGLMLLGVLVAIPQLTQNQDNRSRAFSPTSNPTPKICKVGLNSFGVSTPCGRNSFRQAYYSCYDGTGGKLGGSSSCKLTTLWQKYANQLCKGHSSCNNNPSPSVAYPSKFPPISSGPSIYPSIYPTPAPSYSPSKTPFSPTVHY